MRLGRIMAFATRILDKLVDRCVSGLIAAGAEKRAMEVRHILHRCRDQVQEKLIAADEELTASLEAAPPKSN